MQRLLRPRTSAFCRHARDLQAAEAPLCDILAAGQWKTPAFMAYIDVDELETAAVIQAHMDESSGDEMSAHDEG